MSGFFTELRRRNVFRVAAAYAVIAWILVEVLSTVLPMFGVPEWVLRVLVILLVAGSVPAVIFAWAFEMTPEGIKRESEIDRSESITDHTAKKLDVVVIVLLVIAIGVFTLDRFVLSPRVADAPEVVSIDRIDSIAVLPFEDFSAGGDHAYLGTGIADTILHSLAQIKGLKVVARTSSFQLHEQDADIPTIGRTLGVGAVLEGSVQTSGNRLRITAQLIRTSDQSHLWSRTFDATTDDMFATQDTIAEAVAATLRGADAPKPVAQERTTPEVFELVAKGRHLWQQRNSTDTAEAVSALERAVVLDPDYAQAWSELAAAQWFAFLYGPSERVDAKDAALAAAGRALALDGTLAQPWAIRGLIAGNDADLRAAIAHYERAIELNPNYANAYAWLAEALVNAGLHNDGRSIIERAYRLDPMTYVRGAYARTLMSDDDPAVRRRAVAIVEETLRLTPDSFRAITDAAAVAAQVGDLADAVGYLANGLRQRPDSLTLMYTLIQVLYMLDEREAIERWGSRFDEIAPDALVGNWRFAIHDWEGWVESARRALESQPDSAIAKGNLVSALMQAGRYAEALPLAEEALAWMEAHRYRPDLPSVPEYNLLLQLVWLHEQVGDAGRAVELRRELAPRFEALRRNGFGADFFSTMLVVDQAIMVGDMERAVRRLRGIEANNSRFFAFVWEDIAYWSEFRARDDVRAILAEWRTEQAAARARVREVAADFIYDPALLDSGPLRPVTPGSTFSAGTRTLSKNSDEVTDARNDIAGWFEIAESLGVAEVEAISIGERFAT